MALGDVIYMTRKDWGAANLPRLGYAVEPEKRTEVHVHHTAAVDTSDSTKNRWTTAGALRYQRRLQTVRPDLGADIPYTEVFYVLEDLTVIIMEGRGLARTGAHTRGHNTAGIGWSIAGNFDYKDEEAQRAVLAAIENRFAYLRKVGYPNLGSVKSPRGWWAWGHRDSSNKSCPGNHLYPQLALLNPMKPYYQIPAVVPTTTTKPAPQTVRSIRPIIRPDGHVQYTTSSVKSLEAFQRSERRNAVAIRTRPEIYTEDQQIWAEIYAKVWEIPEDESI